MNLSLFMSFKLKLKLPIHAQWIWYVASSLKFPAIILEAVILAQTQYHEKGESNHL